MNYASGPLPCESVLSLWTGPPCVTDYLRGGLAWPGRAQVLSGAGFAAWPDAFLPVLVF